MDIIIISTHKLLYKEILMLLNKYNLKKLTEIMSISFQFLLRNIPHGLIHVIFCQTR